MAIVGNAPATLDLVVRQGSDFALTLTVELFAKGANGKLRMRRPIYDSPSVTDPAADIAATKGASQTITVEDASTP